MGSIHTGEIIPAKEFHRLPQSEQAKYVEVKRDLSLHEAAKMQIAKYAPCLCGSGKKFKFCCYKP